MNTQNALVQEIENVDVKNVVSVYNGKDGQCCCGCSGKHTYAKRHVKRGAHDRGYAIRPDEIDDATVLRVLNKIKRNAVRATFNRFDKKQIYVVVGTRVYIANMK